MSNSTTAPLQDTVNPDELTRSCSNPVLFLFVKAIGWLVLALALDLLNGARLLAPGLLVNCPWMTFGRVAAAAEHVLIYGFVLQAGMGVLLWLMVRLSRNAFHGHGLAYAAIGLWNLGVLLGLLGILAGMNTGYPMLEMPGFAAIMIGVAYLILGLLVLIQFHGRRKRELYVSQWYLLLALLIFPWAFFAAQMALHFQSVPGMVQGLIYWWFERNFKVLWVVSIGIALILYFVPMLLKRPLQDRTLAFYGFWSLVLVGGWGGVPTGVPLPSWVIGVSVVSTTLLVIPLTCFVLSLYRTVDGQWKAFRTDPTLQFMGIGTIGLLLTFLGEVVAARPFFQALTGLTTYGKMLDVLLYFGFFGIVIFGAIYYIVPRLIDAKWPCEVMIRIHFWGSLIGIVLGAVAFEIGGFAQGIMLNIPESSFLNIIRFSQPIAGLALLASGIFALAQLAFLANLSWLCLLRFGSCCLPAKWLPEELSSNSVEVNA